MAQKINDVKLNALLALNRELVLENDFSKKIQMISDSLKDIIKADRCTVFIHDESTKSLWSIYIDGVSFIEVPDDIGIVSEVYNKKKTMIVNDAQNNPLFNSNIDKGSGYRTQSILSAPIMGFGDNILGVIQLINKLDESKMFIDEDIEVLNYVMSHISAFLEVMIQKD